MKDRRRVYLWAYFRVWALFSMKQASSHHAVMSGRQYSESHFTIMYSTEMWRLPKLQVNWIHSLGVVKGAPSTFALRSVTM
jgi:hypothetical protein